MPENEGDVQRIANSYLAITHCYFLVQFLVFFVVSSLMESSRAEEVRQEVKARGGAIIKIKFAREISDGMLWNV